MSHYCCKRCGLRECICFIEDIPEFPFYYDKYCIRGPEYQIYLGQELETKDIYILFAQKWYDTLAEAKKARETMIGIELLRLKDRIEWLQKNK
jgi:hypothetical protein